MRAARISTRRCRPAFVVALLAPPLFIGCGTSLPTVAGKVTYRGAALSTGNVTLHPAGRSAPGYGTIGSDGSYSIRTGNAEGVAAGEYKITVNAAEPMPPPTPQNPLPTAKSLIPLRYAMPETSGLSLTVQAGANSHDIELVD